MHSMCRSAGAEAADCADAETGGVAVKADLEVDRHLEGRSKWVGKSSTFDYVTKINEPLATV
jgi:hypothetical protein